MKRKNGFTLIELLAVIVILAIIALIAVPQVIKILNSSRLAAAEESTNGIIKAAESYVSNFMLKNNGSLPSGVLEFSCGENASSEKGCFLVNTLSGYDTKNLTKLNFDGKAPTSGTIKISNSGEEIVATNLLINGFTCSSIYGKSSCSKEDNNNYTISTDDRIVYFNPQTGKKCSESVYDVANSNSDNKEGCMKWYKYSTNKNLGTANLILDHNTTSKINELSDFVYYDQSTAEAMSREEIISALEANRTLVNKELNKLVSENNWELIPRSISSDEIAKITNKTNFDKDNSGTRFFLDTNTGYEGSSYNYGWLYDRTSWTCLVKGCFNNAVGGPSTNIFGYYTSDIAYNYNNPSAIPQIWAVVYNAKLEAVLLQNSGGFGVRPVITVLESDL